MKSFKYILALFFILTAILFVLPIDRFELDVLQSFSHLAMVGYIVLAIVLLLWKRWLLSITSFSAGAVILLFLTLHLKDAGSYKYDVNGETFKVAHFNVLGSNTQYDDIIDLSLNSQADLLSFQEVDLNWSKQLVGGLEEEYPYFQFVNGEPHGIAVFSKYPLNKLKTYNWAGVPTLTGDLMINGSSVHFVATHTLSPRTEERFKARNEHLSKVASYLKSVNGPVLAIGDFNAVPWSTSITQIKQQSKMMDSRRGITPTFPASFKLAGIPIDYILHSDELNCLGFDVLETLGSDHRGVVGVYQMDDLMPDLTINSRDDDSPELTPQHTRAEADV